MRAVVVCDAGPLIHLDELGRLDLLNDFFQVVVPASVWQEVQSHRVFLLKVGFKATVRPIG